MPPKLHTRRPLDHTRTPQSDQGQRPLESSDSGHPPSQRDLYLHPGAEPLSPPHLSDAQRMHPPALSSRDTRPTSFGPTAETRPHTRWGIRLNPSNALLPNSHSHTAGICLNWTKAEAAAIQTQP